jgi:hypothetical protein
MEMTKETKKLLKRLYKKHLVKDNYDKLNAKNLINYFSKDRYDSGTNFYIFEGTNEKEILKELDRYIDVEGVKLPYSAYDCTGRYFSNPCNVKVVKEANRTYITQNWFLDV